MVKTAIFVEGQTELILVREFLLRYFEYQDVSLQCFSLASGGNMENARYDFPLDEASAPSDSWRMNPGDMFFLPQGARRAKYGIF